ncbi:MAG: monovalent cation/H+ antiporter complex subunit F [Acidimicrobiales bacterium]
MTEVLEYATLAMLGLAGILALVRVGRGGSLPDKVLGADTLLLVLAAGVAAGAGVAGDGTFLDALVVVTMLSFVGTITVARYVERRGARA